jgi:GNAT superfamily N-acetyltransferase
MGDVSPAAIRAYLPTFRRWFRRELESRRLWGCIAETPAGVAVGGGLLWLQPRMPSPRFRPLASPYLFSVYTAPEHRGKGVASRLVSVLVESARTRGFARVELHSTDMGRHLYERLGFEPTTQMRIVLRGAPSAGRRRSKPRAPNKR